MKIQEDTVVTPTGTSGIYGTLVSPDSVKIILLNEADEIYLVRKFRYPDQSWVWEIPGGGTDGQDPLDAAKRELEEETGYTAETWEHLGTPSICDGFMTQKNYMYIASGNLHSSEKEVSDEIITYAGFYSLGELDDKITSGDMDSGECLAALIYFERWLAKHRSAEK